jgi:hypothetical protein
MRSKQLKDDPGNGEDDEVTTLRARCEKAEAALEFILATKIVPVGDEHAGAHNGKTLIQCHTAAGSALPQHRKGSEAEPFIPCFIANEDAGISELVIADVPTVTGGEMIARPLFDMTTREIVGFQWNTGASASVWKRSEADG